MTQLRFGAVGKVPSSRSTKNPAAVGSGVIDVGLVAMFDWSRCNAAPFHQLRRLIAAGVSFDRRLFRPASLSTQCFSIGGPIGSLRSVMTGQLRAISAFSAV